MTRAAAQVGRAAHAAAAPPPSTALLLAFTSLCSILAPLNSTMIAVTLPQIRADFDLSRGSVAWLVSGYLIAMAVAQPVAGRLGDQLGRGRVVRVGLLLFLGVSAVAGFAPNFALLITLRVAQAIVGAGLIPNAVALIREHASPRQLGQLSGINGAAIAAAAGLGPLFGAGALLLGSWRLVFPISLPFALAALLLLPRLHLRDRSRGDQPAADWSGTAQYAVLLIGLTALLSVGGTLPVLWRALAWAAFALALAGFVAGQRRSAAPAAAWGLFRIRSFAAASLQTLLTNLAMYTTLLTVPFLVTDLLSASGSASGLLLGLMALLMGAIAPFGGRLSDWWGRRRSAQLGAVVVVVASVWLYIALGDGLTMGRLAAILVLLGAGVGMATGAASTAAVEAAPRAMAGAAAGTSSMMRYVGSIVGAGVLGASLSSASGPGGRPPVGAFEALQLVVLVMAAAAAVAACFVHSFVADEPAEPTKPAPAPSR